LLSFEIECFFGDGRNGKKWEEMGRDKVPGCLLVKFFLLRKLIDLWSLRKKELSYKLNKQEKVFFSNS